MINPCHLALIIVGTIFTITFSAALAVTVKYLYTNHNIFFCILFRCKDIGLVFIVVTSVIVFASLVLCATGIGLLIKSRIDQRNQRNLVPPINIPT